MQRTKAYRQKLAEILQIPQIPQPLRLRGLRMLQALTGSGNTRSIIQADLSLSGAPRSMNIIQADLRLSGAPPPPRDRVTSVAMSPGQRFFFSLFFLTNPLLFVAHGPLPRTP